MQVLYSKTYPPHEDDVTTGESTWVGSILFKQGDNSMAHTFHETPSAGAAGWTLDGMTILPVILPVGSRVCVTSYSRFRRNYPSRPSRRSGLQWRNDEARWGPVALHDPTDDREEGKTGEPCR